jgi:hypothetical protein
VDEVRLLRGYWMVCEGILLLLFLDQCRLVLVILGVTIVKVDELDLILPPNTLVEVVDSRLFLATPCQTFGVRQAKFISLFRLSWQIFLGSLRMLCKLFEGQGIKLD